jgi:hypothetical protein
MYGGTPISGQWMNIHEVVAILTTKEIDWNLRSCPYCDYRSADDRKITVE